MESGSVLITGGGGFVGRHLIAELQRNNSFSRIVVLDAKEQDYPRGVEGRVCDIAQSSTYAPVIADVRPDWVIHLAAVSSVPFAIKHPELTRTVNVIATDQLIDTTLSVSPSASFLIISSADIYGSTSSDPVAELPLAKAHPLNPYAESKLEMERLIEEKYNASCIRVRPFPHIGPGQATGFVTSDFASQIAAIEKGIHGPTMLVGNLDAKRDFTDVRDVVRAYRLLIEEGRKGEVYHVASSRVHAISEVLEVLLSFSTASITVTQDPSRMRPSENSIVVGSIEKIMQETSWKPEIPFRDSLRDILEDWRSRV